jgi:hypothetical protein
MEGMAAAPGDVGVECGGHLGGNAECINGQLADTAWGRKAATRTAECFHNFCVLARTLPKKGINVFGMCNFKQLRVAEIAHPATIARLIDRSTVSDTA